jgi:hypothetical protein
MVDITIAVVPDGRTVLCTMAIEPLEPDEGVVSADCATATASVALPVSTRASLPEQFNNDTETHAMVYWVYVLILPFNVEVFASVHGVNAPCYDYEPTRACLSMTRNLRNSDPPQNGSATTWGSRTRQSNKKCLFIGTSNR